MNTQKITTYLQSPKLSVIIRILLVVFILIVVFWAGVSVGWRKAEFSYRFSENYSRSFGSHGRSPANMMGILDPDDLIGGHGATGKVISISLPNIIVSDANGVEKIVHIDTNTQIRSGRGGVASTTITDNDFVVVIGTPGIGGQVIAKLIRVIPPPPLTMGSTTFIMSTSSTLR